MEERTELTTRRRLYIFIEDNPGIHFRGIQRALDLSVGQLDHHLNRMEKEGIITKDEMKGNTRYFPAGILVKAEKRLMGFLRKEMTRNILLYLYENPGSTPNEMLEVFEISGPNLSYHLRRLFQSEFISFEEEGRNRRYFIIDTERLEKLLVTYRTTLLDKIVDRLL